MNVYGCHCISLVSMLLHSMYQLPVQTQWTQGGRTKTAFGRRTGRQQPIYFQWRDNLIERQKLTHFQWRDIPGRQWRDNLIERQKLTLSVERQSCISNQVLQNRPQWNVLHTPWIDYFKLNRITKCTHQRTFNYIHLRDGHKAVNSWEKGGGGKTKTECDAYKV